MHVVVRNGKEGEQGMDAVEQRRVLYSCERSIAVDNIAEEEGDEEDEEDEAPEQRQCGLCLLALTGQTSPCAICGASRLHIRCSSIANGMCRTCRSALTTPLSAANTLFGTSRPPRESLRLPAVRRDIARQRMSRMRQRVPLLSRVSSCVNDEPDEETKLFEAFLRVYRGAAGQHHGPIRESVVASLRAGTNVGSVRELQESYRRKRVRDEHGAERALDKEEREDNDGGLSSIWAQFDSAKKKVFPTYESLKQLKHEITKHVKRILDPLYSTRQISRDAYKSIAKSATEEGMRKMKGRRGGEASSVVGIEGIVRALL
ncbi:hypothetical protein HDU98_002875 [Podochytrium sp. JEL0797]|nr:hypothetical protein HDU98_002875 [Podochytrium sp. JEL0797]